MPGTDAPRPSTPAVPRPALFRGETTERVTALRQLLAAAGHPVTGAEPDDPRLFDAGVDEAVRAFQQHRGLIVDGVVGPQTTAHLESARWHLGDRLLRFVAGHPMTGDDVVALQQRLQVIGVLDERIDGEFGPHTEAALRELQRGLGLLSDGVFGPATIRALDQLSRAVTGGNAFGLVEHDRVVTAGTSLSGRVIVIDPAAGGAEPGHVADVGGRRVPEADIVFDIASRLEGRLAALGVSALLTRGPGSSPSDEQRIELAEKVHADLLLSLHCDVLDTPAANGVATYYWGTSGSLAASPVGRAFAGIVQREVVARTGLLDCRSHARTWDLLARVSCPAVWLDLGYLSNPLDAARLADPGFRDTLVDALVVAIQRLYLPPEQDRPTGTLDLNDVRHWSPGPY